MPTDLPALRAALFGHIESGAQHLPSFAADLAAYAALVRAAALTEAEAVIRTTELPEDHIDLFDNGADWAAGLVHTLAATPKGHQ